MSDYLPCSSYYHNLQSGSLYKKDKVPCSLFLNERTGRIYKSCIDCRNVKNKKSRVTREVATYNYHKFKNQQDEDIKNNKDYITCPCKSHNAVSNFPRNMVPIDNFKKHSNRINSSLNINCSDCCLYNVTQYKTNREKLIEYSEKLNIIRCSRCEQELDDSNRVMSNGESLLTCKTCKYEHDMYIQNGKNLYNRFKYEFITKYQSCCCLCYNLFIIEPNNLSIVEIPTFIIEDILYCQYENVRYKSLDFINLYKNKILLGILEFDHLTEKEQRDSGILYEQDVYEKKISEVSKMYTEENMLHEIQKCQLICGKCHVIETMRREKGVEMINRPIETRLKLTYCNELKKNGCSNCHYVNNELPRFFHFDHLNPDTKIANISNMIFQSKYTYNDMLNEIEKTRILCKYCHYIVTQNQHKQGLIKTNSHVYRNQNKNTTNID